MIKKGFTLAEILIVMGIVGVIAALTLPMLMTSVSNKSNAANLSAAISDVENAFTYMLTSEKVGDILDSDFWRGEFDSDSIKSIGKYLKISVADKDFRDYDYYTLKDNGVMYVSFKYGDFEGIIDDRYFTYLTEEDINYLGKEKNNEKHLTFAPFFYIMIM